MIVFIYYYCFRIDYYINRVKKMNKLNLDSRQVYLLEEFFSGLESISLQIESASEYLKNGDIKSALISLERTGKKVKASLTSNHLMTCR